MLFGGTENVWHEFNFVIVVVIAIGGAVTIFVYNVIVAINIAAAIIVIAFITAIIIVIVIIAVIVVIDNIIAIALSSARLKLLLHLLLGNASRNCVIVVKLDHVRVKHFLWNVGKISLILHSWLQGDFAVFDLVVPGLDARSGVVWG